MIYKNLKIFFIPLNVFLFLLSDIQAWTPVTVEMTPPIIGQLPGWQTVCLVPDIHGAVIAGGYQEMSSEPSNAVMAYRIGLNRWDFLDVGPSVGGPQSDYISVAGHDQGASCYDERLHAFVTPSSWAMGSVSGNMCHYDVRGNIGRLYYPVPFSAGFTSNLVFSCYDSDSNCIYFLNSSQGNPVGRLCRYKPSENAWKLLATCPDVLNGYDQSICYDKALKRVMIPGSHCYNPATNLWEASSPLDSFVLYNAVARQTVSKASPIARSPTRSIIFDPYTNKYFHVDFGGSGYTGLVKEEAGESGAPFQVPAFSHESYQTDSRWVPLANGLQFNPLGFAQTPHIVSHNGSLFLTWNEWGPASYPPTCYSATEIARWNGISWTTTQLSTAYTAYPTLQSCNGILYSATSNLRNTCALSFRLTGDKFDTLKNGGPISNAVNDGSMLPQWVAYRNRLHILYFTQYPWRAYGSMGHSVWNESATKWDIVNASVVAAPYSLTAQNPGVFLSLFSARAFGDSIVAAITLMQASPRPMTLSIRCYDGTSWKTLPAPSFADTNHVCVFPSLAVDSARHAMYLGYTARPFSGRKNNELVVEQWTGTRWRQLGTALNVNDSTRDGWAFRPSLAVSPAGVLYAAWTEHVWGSCPQVYVAHWNGSGWVRDFVPGSSLNHDGTNGSAQSVSLTFDNGKPTVAWAEHAFGGGSFRKIHVKQFAGVITADDAGPNHHSSLRITAAPNPFNPSSHISISLPVPSVVRLEVFDASGSHVRTLKNGMTAAGTHGFTWNGTDDAGRTVSGGLYVYRFFAGQRVLTAKAVYLK